MELFNGSLSKEQDRLSIPPNYFIVDKTLCWLEYFTEDKNHDCSDTLMGFVLIGNVISIKNTVLRYVRLVCWKKTC